MATKLRKSLQTIEAYKAANPHYNDLLDILAEILVLREEYRNNMEEAVFTVDERIIAQKMEGGLPLIDFIGGKFDLTHPKEYFNSLIAIAEKKMPEEAKNIAELVNDKHFDWEKMILSSFNKTEEEAMIEGEDKDLETEDNLDLIDLFVEESLRPELEYIADRYGKIVAKSGWTEGYCPICGKEPKIGEIRGDEEGKRYLFCHQCGYKWHFRRIKCPFCGNEEQHSLAYFAVEGEEHYRVDVCNKCRRYIKIVDLPKTDEEANLDVEDIATLHLDMLACEEGYN
jgi:FdhE protein